MNNQASKIPGAPTPNSAPKAPEKVSPSSPQKTETPEKLETSPASNKE
jgi:hypothetical protein